MSHSQSFPWLTRQTTNLNEHSNSSWAFYQMLRIRSCRKKRITQAKHSPVVHSKKCDWPLQTTENYTVIRSTKHNYWHIYGFVAVLWVSEHQYQVYRWENTSTNTSRCAVMQCKLFKCQIYRWRQHTAAIRRKPFVSKNASFTWRGNNPHYSMQSNNGVLRNDNRIQNQSDSRSVWVFSKVTIWYE